MRNRAAAMFPYEYFMPNIACRNKKQKLNSTFLPAAKPRRSMDHKITVGGRGGRVLICLLGKFCKFFSNLRSKVPCWLSWPILIALVAAGL